MLPATPPFILAADPPADDFRNHPRWRLVAFLLCSLLSHLVCFYLFQVAYPPAAPPPPVPVTIYLPAPGTPEAAQVAAWAEAADPARLTLPPLPSPARALETAGANEYEPSFARKP